MSNRLVYEDYAVGALELAKCMDIGGTGTTQLMSVESGTVVDRYKVDSIFQNESAYQCASFDNSGIKLTEPFHIMNASDDSGDKVGFVSAEISDASGTFTSAQQIQIEFLDENENATVHTGNGVSLWFNTHYCKRISVSYFDPEDNQVATYTYDNVSSLYTFLSGRAVGYSKVIVAFLETERPFQRAMVSKFRFGRTVEIDQFKSISFNKKLDFYGADIAINSLDVAFYSEEELQLTSQQKILLYHNDALVGTYWVADAEQTTNRLYSVSADDVFSQLDNKSAEPLFSEDAKIVDGKENNGFYVSDISKIISGVANVVISGKADDEIKGYLEKSSYRKLLAESIFAFHKYAKALPDGSVYIFDKISENAIVIDGDKIIGNAEYKDLARCTSVNVTVDQFFQTLFPQASGNSIAEGAYISSNPERVKTTFPAIGLEVRDLSGNKIDSNNFLVTKIDDYTFTIKSSSSSVFYGVGIWGCPYKKDAREYYKGTTAYVGERVEQKDFGHKSFYGTQYPTWFDLIAERAFSVSGQVNAKVILGDLDVGDYVEIQTKYSGRKKGTITEISADVGCRDIVGNVVITVWE